MNQDQRRERIRLLVRKTNQKHKRQAKKIDILCNNLITAQKNFIQKLDTISFAANFYESIVGMTELASLLYTASKAIKEKSGDAKVSFFLRKPEDFELHVFESDYLESIDNLQLENCFTSDLVENICKSNKLCTLESLLSIGLQVKPSMLNKIFAVTIPLCQIGASLGFILICRSSVKKITSAEINEIAAVTNGLSRAIASCQMISCSSN